jgi:hypothetical protein
MEYMELREGDTKKKKRDTETKPSMRVFLGRRENLDDFRRIPLLSDVKSDVSCVGMSSGSAASSPVSHHLAVANGKCPSCGF